ncbi:MAG: hypothetical protein ACI976_000241 [Aureispira sp.]|jgi:hypothetical protein
MAYSATNFNEDQINVKVFLRHNLKGSYWKAIWSGIGKEKQDNLLVVIDISKYKSFAAQQSN